MRQHEINKRRKLKQKRRESSKSQVEKKHVNVLKADTPELINARLCLVLSFKLTLEKALNLIGIIAPQRM